MPASARALHDWHASPGAFSRLAPTWQHLRHVRAEGGIRDGGVRIFRLGRGPLAPVWEAHHEDWIEGRQFVDRAVRSPFRAWRHVHRFEPVGEGESLLIDEISYRLPLPRPLEALLTPLAQRQLERMFRQRHARTAQDLMRHQRTSEALTIAITGASGLIGNALGAFLETGGHRVLRLVRRDAKNPEEVSWDPACGTIDADALEGVDVIVHLAGEGIAAERWTEAQKERILRSRVDGTRLIARTAAGLHSKRPLLISASAVGYYGSRGDEVLDEESAAGDGFLPEVCRAWEEAADPARDAGLRVIHPRFGIVLSPQGGALARMLPPFRLGLGGVVGSGEQYMSTISLDDAVGAIHWLMTEPDSAGAYNVVNPDPVSNRVFTKTLGAVLGRPAILPLPGFALRAGLGEMGQRLLLEGQRVRPARLQAEGFRFLHPTLEASLRFELGRLREEDTPRRES